MNNFPLLLASTSDSVTLQYVLSESFLLQTAEQ